MLAEQAGAPQLAASSLKAALDLDWDDPAARDRAVAEVLGCLDAVEAFVAGQPGDEAAATAVATACQVRDQDVDLSGPVPSLRRGVARDRRISVEDPDMRHGRKSRSVRFDGDKRHVLRDLDSGLIPAVGITPANVPEAAVTDDIAAGLAAGNLRLAELHIDRAYLSSALVRDRGGELAIFCKAWRVRNTTGRFPKNQFTIDFGSRQLTCPAGVAISFQPGNRALPEGHLRGLPAAHALHVKPVRAQRCHPPRRGAAGRAPRTPGHRRRPRQAPRAHQGRTCPRPRRPLARPASPLPRHPQEPIRPAPRRRDPQPPRHRTTGHRLRLPAGSLTTTRPAL